MKKGFDAEKYAAAQSAEILKRVRSFGRLYLEVGGKLCRDEHAARVLPGYRRGCKVEILRELEPDFVYCISASDLVSGREVGLSGVSFEEKMFGDLKEIEFNFFRSKRKIKVVVSMFNGEDLKRVLRKLKRRYDVYVYDEVEGYGSDLGATLAGYDRNSYVELKSDLVVVTGVGGGSGKMGFCMSQLYYERKVKSAFAKFESFPIWNLSKNHPVNFAYEAATADLGDYNMIDVYHKRAYRKRAVNYNRDVENFEILLKMMRKVTGERWPFGYRSPTDMGVNMMRVGIVDDALVRRSAVAEIRRRLRKAKKGSVEKERIGKIIKKLARG